MNHESIKSFGEDFKTTTMVENSVQKKLQLVVKNPLHKDLMLSWFISYHKIVAGQLVCVKSAQ